MSGRSSHSRRSTGHIVHPPARQEYCGAVSGRDHNKFKEKQLTAIPSAKVKTPIVKEGMIHFECRVVNKNDLIPSELTKPIVTQLYSEGDFHRIYFGEILACQCES